MVLVATCFGARVVDVMSSPESLDALLAEIKSDHALSLAETEVVPPSATVVEVVPEVTTRAETERNQLWESNLTPRQRALPKISLQMMSGLVAVMVLFAGVTAATLLTQQSQDIRQQAYEDSTGEISGPAASLTQAQLESQTEASEGSESFTVSSILSRDWTTLELVILVAGGAGVVFLLGLLWWVFQDEE